VPYYFKEGFTTAIVVDQFTSWRIVETMLDHAVPPVNLKWFAKCLGTGLFSSERDVA
jgi:hypothetical protein